MRSGGPHLEWGLPTLETAPPARRSRSIARTLLRVSSVQATVVTSVRGVQPEPEPDQRSLAGPLIASIVSPESSDQRPGLVVAPDNYAHKEGGATCASHDLSNSEPGSRRPRPSPSLPQRRSVPARQTISTHRTLQPAKTPTSMTSTSSRQALPDARRSPSRPVRPTASSDRSTTPQMCVTRSTWTVTVTRLRISPTYWTCPTPRVGRW